MMLTDKQKNGVLSILNTTSKPLTTAQIYDRLKVKVSVRRPGEEKKYVTQQQVGNYIHSLVDEGLVSKSENCYGTHCWIGTLKLQVRISYEGKRFTTFVAASAKD